MLGAQSFFAQIVDTGIRAKVVRRIVAVTRFFHLRAADFLLPEPSDCDEFALWFGHRLRLVDLPSVGAEGMSSNLLTSNYA